MKARKTLPHKVQFRKTDDEKMITLYFQDQKACDEAKLWVDESFEKQ
jgi:hypothetical protein